MSLGLSTWSLLKSAGQRTVSVAGELVTLVHAAETTQSKTAPLSAQLAEETVSVGVPEPPMMVLVPVGPSVRGSRRAARRRSGAGAWGSWPSQ